MVWERTYTFVSTNTPCVMLTKREIEVLQLISQELTTEQIANRLQVSISTIETHRHNLLQKLGARSVVGMIKEAYKQGLID